jgi:hypothetical protein
VTLAPDLAQQRMGKLTASMAATVMGGLKTEGLDRYVRRLAGERVFGDLSEPNYQSPAMARGDELENSALDLFEFQHGVTLQRQAHVDHPTIPNVAATPDGLDEQRRYTVEAKSPLFHVWAETREACGAERLSLAMPLAAVVLRNGRRLLRRLSPGRRRRDRSLFGYAIRV